MLGGTGVTVIAGQSVRDARSGQSCEPRMCVGDRMTGISKVQKRFYGPIDPYDPCWLEEEQTALVEPKRKEHQTTLGVRR